jgi:hypothetical protein
MQTALLHPYPHPHPHPLHLDACRPPRHSPDRKSDLLQSPESRFLILPLIYLPPQICSESAGTGDIHVQSTFSASFPQIRSIVHSAAPTSTRIPALNPPVLPPLQANSAGSPEAQPRALPDHPPCLSVRSKSTITSRYLSRRNLAPRISSNFTHPGHTTNST